MASVVNPKSANRCHCQCHNASANAYDAFFSETEPLVTALDGEKLAQAHEELTTEILRLRRLQSTVSCMHNRIRAATRAIPPGIMVMIFERCSQNLTDANIRKSWFAFSLVCRQWRTTALSQAGVWTRIPLSFTHPESTLTMIRRSAPLPFHLNIATSTKVEEMRALAAFWYSVPQDDPVRLDSMDVNFVSPAENLRLDGPAMPVRWLDLPTLQHVRSLSIYANEWITFQDANMSGQLPRLQQLSICAAIRWFPGNFPPTLRSIAIDHTGQLDWNLGDDLLTKLSDLPGLRRLHLTGAFRRWDREHMLDSLRPLRISKEVFSQDFLASLPFLFLRGISVQSVQSASHAPIVDQSPVLAFHPKIIVSMELAGCDNLVLSNIQFPDVAARREIALYRRDTSRDIRFFRTDSKVTEETLSSCPTRAGSHLCEELRSSRHTITP